MFVLGFSADLGAATFISLMRMQRNVACWFVPPAPSYMFVHFFGHGSLPIIWLVMRHSLKQKFICFATLQTLLCAV